MATFEPDEPITSIKVKIYTADVAEGGTDDDVFIELFDWPKGFEQLQGILPCAAEIDTSNYNDFERGSKRVYELPSWYYADRIVNDIRRVCVHKSDDGPWGGWAFQGITVWLNGKKKELFTSLNPEKPNDFVWLEDDDRSWCGSYTPIEFIAPSIENVGLPDADSDMEYDVGITATGGRKPLSWSLIEGKGHAFTQGPLLAFPTEKGTRIRFQGHTVKTTGTASWSGKVKIRDADGRESIRQLAMKVVETLPAPQVIDMRPDFGWPGLVPAAPDPVVVTLWGKNFDSRKLANTRVFFSGAGGSTGVKGKLLESTSEILRVEVPKNAVPGSLTVTTDFGSAKTPGMFRAHPNGYRFRNGFAFTNQAEDDDPSDGFPNTYAWERFEQAFGVCEMWVCIMGQGTVPNPVATLFYLTAHDLIGNGLCHGFGLTGLQMTEGILPISAFKDDDRGYPLEDSLWNLTGKGAPSSGLSKWIQSRQLVVWSDEGLSYYLDRLDSIPNVFGMACQMDARDALEDMESALANGLADPRLLAFAQRCWPWEGHVVVPYKVEKQDGSEKLIRVYDPNKPVRAKDPDDKESFFWIKTSDGDWGYSWSDGTLWQGVYMFTIALTEYGHQEDWSLPGMGTLIGTAETFMLGCASSGGGASIQQATDRHERPLFKAAGLLRDRAEWPEGIRPMPLFDPAGRKRTMLALTSAAPVSFVVRPESSVKGERLGSGFFSLLRGADLSISVEDFDRRLDLRFDPTGNELAVKPIGGKATAIVRLARKFGETAESLTYALRVRDVRAGESVRVAPAPTGRGVRIGGGDGQTQLDLEVTHTSRIGEQRILQCDGVAVPRRAVATFDVPVPEDLDVEEAKPVTMTIELDGGVETHHLVSGANGPVLEVPHRVVAWPKPTVRRVQASSTQRLVAPGSAARRKTRVEVPATAWSPHAGALRIRALDPATPIRKRDRGALTVELLEGTRPLRLIAEDAEGRRSFPRTVFVTVPEEDRPPISPLTFFGKDVDASPGKTAEIPVGAYTTDVPVSRVAIDLSVRTRRSGSGRGWPTLGEAPFELSPPLKELGATVTATPGRGGVFLHLEIDWDAKAKRAGRIDLGHLPVHIPSDMPFGSTFVMLGKGSVGAGGARGGRRIPVTVIPTLIRVWGGPEPGSLSIQGPEEVAEQADARFGAQGSGVESPARNAGWWVESLGGRADVLQDQPQGAGCRVVGRRAGWVRLHVVVGTRTAERLVRIAPTVKAKPHKGSGLRADVLRLVSAEMRHSIRQPLVMARGQRIRGGR